MLSVKPTGSVILGIMGLFVMGVAFAGGNSLGVPVNNMSDTAAAVASQPAAVVVSSSQLARASQNGVYVGADVANLWEDWQHSSVSATGKNNTTATVFSGYLGYQYTQNYGVEVGYLYLPPVGGAKMASTGGTTGEIKSYVIDAEIKLIQPFYKQLGVFAKGGLAYRSLTLNGDTSMYTPIFGAGLEFVLNPNFSFDFSYNYIGGTGALNAASIESVPTVNMAMLGVNYNFSS